MLTTSKCTSAKCYLFLKIHLLPCGGVGWGEKNLCPNYFPRVSGHNLFFNIADAFKNSWISYFLIIVEIHLYFLCGQSNHWHVMKV